jgi:hypothetical protein
MDLKAQDATGTPALADVTRSALSGEYRDSRRGFAMALSGGFGFGASQQGLTILGSKAVPGAIFIKTGERFSATELQQAAKQGYRDDGVQLTPLGPTTTLTIEGGLGMAVPVQGTLEDARVLGLLAGVITGSGECFVLLAATTPEQWSKLEPDARKMFASIRLFAPEVPPVDRQWQSYFAGSRLSYYFSRTSASLTGTIEGGAGATVHIDFCGDGTFLYGDKSRMSFDLPQAFGYRHSQSNASGRWNVQAAADAVAALTLEFYDGRVWRYQARGDRELTYLNGSRYSRSRSQVCQ